MSLETLEYLCEVFDWSTDVDNEGQIIIYTGIYETA